MPVTWLPSPWTSAAHLMSPLTFPSRCRSAVAVRSPLTAMSAPRTEKVGPVMVALPGGRSIDSGFFENIGRYLQKGTRIDGLVVKADLEMQVRPGRTAGAADRADRLAGNDRFTDTRAERGHMGVARSNAVAMIDLDAIAIAGTPSNERDLAPGGSIDGGADRPLEIEPGMEGRAAREGIVAEAEARGNMRAGGGNNLRDSLHPPLQRIHPRKTEPEAPET